MTAVILPSVCSMYKKLLLTFILQCCSAAAENNRIIPTSPATFTQPLHPQ